MYLDCYHEAAILGDKFPVNSYGPADIEKLEILKKNIENCFTKTIITPITKGQNCLPEELWPKLKGIDND